MESLKKVFHYFLFGNFFIALVATVMAESCYSFFNFPSNPLILLFLFFGTLCSYSLHWFLSGETLVGKEREAWNLSHKNFLLVVFGVSTLASLLLFFLLEPETQALSLVLALATFLYTAPKLPFQPFVFLRRLAFGKTIYLAAVWTITTVLLPLSEWDMLQSPYSWMFVIHRLLLILPICVLFDSKDKESDQQQGIKNIVYSLTWKETQWVIISCIFLYILSSYGLVFDDFNLRLFLQLALPGVGLAILLPLHEKKPSDYYYYLWLDGLMMGSGIFMLLF